MAILDNLRDLVTNAIPQKRRSLPVPGSTGDHLILRKSFIVAGCFQIFLAFLAMCCFAGVASFQARFNVGPSALSVIAIFDSLILLFLASFLLAVPVIYDRYDKLKHLARALRIIRVACVCNGIGVFFSLITAFITTISVFTQAGCKDPKTDESARSAGQAFIDGLPGWCQTKRAGSVFFWLTLIAWLVTSYLTFQEWRTGKTIYRPEDPPFALPSQPVVHHQHTTSTDDTDPYTRHRGGGGGEEDEEYEDDDGRSPFSDAVAHNTALNTAAGSGGVPYPGGGGGGGRYAGYGNAPGRPSMDTYGAFSDPSPSGYGGGGGGGRQAYAQPDVSKTMQYADPYAAVRASIHSNTPPPMPQPPPFDGYQR